jgi:hypothetical protein
MRGSPSRRGRRSTVGVTEAFALDNLDCTRRDRRYAELQPVAKGDRHKSASLGYAFVARTARNAAPKVVSSPSNGSTGAINRAINRQRG